MQEGQTPETLLARITADPEVCHGKPVIRGLRYPVAWLLDLLGSGMAYNEVLADYPDLEPADIHAAQLYAARLAQEWQVPPDEPRMAGGAGVSALKLTIRLVVENDGRWLGVVDTLPGVIAYGATRDEAAAKTQALALWRIADQLDAGELAPVDAVEFVQASGAPSPPP